MYMHCAVKKKHGNGSYVLCECVVGAAVGRRRRTQVRHRLRAAEPLAAVTAAVDVVRAAPPRTVEAVVPHAVLVDVALTVLQRRCRDVTTQTTALSYCRGGPPWRSESPIIFYGRRLSLRGRLPIRGLIRTPPDTK